MKRILVILVLLIFSPNLFAWEKVPVPDSVDKKTKSPWNFYENFEDGKFRFKYVTNSTNISNSPGKKPYKIKKDLDGNSYLEITVKHKWNKCCRGNFHTERAEIYHSEKPAKEKIVWYGFKVRLPKDFVHIDDRVLFNQFMNNFEGMKKSPLLGLRFFDEGKRLNIGGDTGGVAHKSWNKEESLKYKKQIDYYLKNKKWSQKKIPKKYEHLIDWSLCFTSFKPPYCYIDNKKDFKNKDKNLRSEEEIRHNMEQDEIETIETFDATPLGEWTIYKVGIYITKTNSGFVKVYKDDILIFDYEGVTFDWKGSYNDTVVKIGLYRDSDPSGKGYPDQVMHFDDFTIVSDKRTLDELLSEQGNPALVVSQIEFTEESFVEFKKNNEVSFGIDVKNKISLGDGVYDFDNIPIRYIGKNKKCGSSRSGSDPFIFILGKNTTIKNMNITKSSPDGIDISRHSKTKFENLNINHSCDEGITLREGSEIIISDSKIVNHDNKGIMFDNNNRATIKNTEFIIEQTFSLNDFGLLINLENVIIRRHPLADYGRLITGGNCGDIEINIKKTKFYGIQQLDGTKNCSNIKINKN